MQFLHCQIYQTENETHSTGFPRENSYYIMLDCESSAYQKLHQNSTNFIGICYSYVINIYKQNVNEKKSWFDASSFINFVQKIPYL